MIARREKLIGQGIVLLILSFMAVLFILPFFWMLSSSLKINAQLFMFPPVWIPNPIHWPNFKNAVTMIPFLTYFRNTIFLVVMNIIGIAFSCTLVGYGFGRIRWPGRQIVFYLVLSTMLVPFFLRIIPLFILYRKLHWIDTFFPLFVPAYFGNPFYIFIMKEFFGTIPDELTDAGRIDGCNEFGIFRRVILPLTKPAVATIVLFEMMFVWHDFIRPLIYLNSQENYTLALGLQQFFTLYGAEWGPLMAAASLITIPIVVAFFFTQRTFIEGIHLTGLKG
jgi:multiple sugar transport system permease protein